jgi:2-(1,2-epoxy-1,2-dihydrophenyl)acetyl-CoA isomerase
MEDDPPMNHEEARTHAVALYDALAAGDRGAIGGLLHPEFVGQTTAGLPLGLGGTYEGPHSMRREFWGRIGQSFEVRAVPTDFSFLDDGTLLVQGQYRGHAREGGELDAEFFHIISFRDRQISRLQQLTDSQRWVEAVQSVPAAAPAADEPAVDNEPTCVEYSFQDGLATVRLNRPEARNALNQKMADELLNVAIRLAELDDLRAVLITGNGPTFTVGGDIEVFAEESQTDLPELLRRMTIPYHAALSILAELKAPIVCAVRGAAAGGGLGLVYCADIVLAAHSAKFASGFTALGLSGDGGNSWFLPRLVGPRRAAEFYFEGRVLSAEEAREWGIVSRLVPDDSLEQEAHDVALRLAAGPTSAFSEIRRLLKGSWEATLPEQLFKETAALARTSKTEDAAGAISSFINKQRPTFRGL